MRMRDITGRTAPAILYHVVSAAYRQGDPLLSLHDQMGDDAYDEFDKRWPESGGMGVYHAHLIFFYQNVDDALEHADAFGGTVYGVDTSQLNDLRYDTLEGTGYWVTNRPVPASALSRVAQR